MAVTWFNVLLETDVPGEQTPHVTGHARLASLEYSP